MIKILTIFMLSFFAYQPQVMADDLADISIYTEDYPPYNYRGKNGHIQGIAVKLLIDIHQHANVDFDKDRIKLRPWDKAYHTLIDNPNTLLFSMTRTPEREELFKWVGPISDTKIVLLAKKSSGIKITQTSEISNYIIGGIRDDIGLSLVTNLVVNKGQINEFSSATAIAKMLNLGRIDLWAYEENVALGFLQSLNLNPSEFETVYTLSTSQLYYAFNINTEQITIDTLQQKLDAFRLAQ
ncbi:transporter substrate-binding domain-containing protein [Gammaproteobacteria bacterium AS21]